MGYHDHSNDRPVTRTVQVFKNGRSRAIRIPKEFEFEAETAVLRLQPDGSILISAAATTGLLDYLKTAEPWTGGDFLSDDSDLSPLDEVNFP